VKAAAETFRSNPNLDTAKVISELGVGEALVSVLDLQGRPTPVERVMVCPPESRIGPLSDSERSELLSRSPLKGRYDTALDRESAYELLKQRADEPLKQTAASSPAAKSSRRPGRPRQTIVEAMAKSAARSIGSSLGRQIVRGILGSLLGKRR
jgi:hypothetical protein